MEQENIELQQVKIESPRTLEEETNDIIIPKKKSQFSCSATCPFSNQEHHKSDAAQRSKTSLKLSGLIIFYTVLMAIEIIGGLKSNSLAILTDAAHLLSDIAGFSISLFTVWVSGWDPTPQQSFGFNRLEVIGALLSVQLIWLISATLIYEAVQRIISQQTEINGKLMFAVSAFGFLVNLILVLWLGHGHDHDHDHDHNHNHNHNQNHNHNHNHNHHGHAHHACEHDHEVEETTKLVPAQHANIVPAQHANINIQGAYLHLITDLIQSVGVMIAGLVIWLRPNWLVVDLVCTLVFSVFALCATLPMLKSVFYVLMERAPHEIDVARLESGLRLIPGVGGVHDLHVWAVTLGKHVLACHVVIGPGVCSSEILHEIRDYCERGFGIHHVTVQIEQEL
ncbi:hypothetical protein ACP275_04G087400 [Erythranthe tilingii]